MTRMIFWRRAWQIARVILLSQTYSFARLAVFYEKRDRPHENAEPAEKKKKSFKGQNSCDHMAIGRLSIEEAIIS
ncbi:MAG: hypothetical protein V1918_01530 [Planctomycetota bacterium]